jgi:SAM-dependent methyltransferase
MSGSSKCCCAEDVEDTHMDTARPWRPPDVPSDWPDRFFGPFFLEVTRRLGKYESTQADAAQLEVMLGLKRGAAILDVPCGFGRFSSVLHASGYRVTGIDSSQFLLEEARKHNPGPVYVLGDMRTPPAGPFDAVLNLWTSFGYFSEVKEDVAALAAWWAVLRPGGQLVMEFSDLERATVENRVGSEEHSYRRHEAHEVLVETWIDWRSNLVTVSYSMDGRTVTTRTRIYSKEQLEGMFKQVGFSRLEFYGGFDQRQKRPQDRLVIQAYK